MPKWKPTVLNEKASLFPKLHHFTTEEMLNLAETDHEHLEKIQDDMELTNARHNLPAPAKLESLKSMKKRIGSDRTKQLYEKAYNIYQEQLYKKDLHYNQLKEKYPEKDGKQFVCDDANLLRLTSCITDPNESDSVNLKALGGDSAKVMKKIVQKLMTADISGIFSKNPETFLEAMEKNDVASVVLNAGQLSTAFGLDKAFDKDLNLNPDGPLMKKYAKSPEHPDGLEENELQFIKENMSLFMMLNSCGNRLLEMATPFYYTFPEGDLEHPTMTMGIEDNGGFLGKDANQYTDGEHFANSKGSYAAYFNKSTPYAVYPDILDAHPEIQQNGWLNADYSAKMLQPDGSYKVVEKTAALLEYHKNPENIKFELNAYGLEKEPSKAADRKETNALVTKIQTLEKELNEIYGSSWNASPEFNALAKSFAAMKKTISGEQGKKAPNMDKLSDQYAEMQEKAAKYLKAKEAELQKSGKSANKTRQRRMEFARKIMGAAGPKPMEQAKKKLDSVIAQKQKDLRAIIDQGRKKDSPLTIDQLKTGIKEKMSEILAAQALHEYVKNSEFSAIKSALPTITSPKAISEAAADIKKSKPFKLYTDFINKETDSQKLLDFFEDIAASKKSGICMKNGVKQAHLDFLGANKKVRDEQKNMVHKEPAKEKTNTKTHEAKGLKN